MRAGPLAASLAGLSALAAAMGVGRFAFTPMLPLMLRDGAFDVADAGWLAAANYGGYLAGALCAARVPLAPRSLCIAALAVIAASTAAMAAGGLAWWLAVRFVAGVCSAWALVATSAACLAYLSRRGDPWGAGIVYSGVGTGIALAGLLCWIEGARGIAAQVLWLELAALAAAMLLVTALLLPDEGRTAVGGPAVGMPDASGTGAKGRGAATPTRLPRGYVLCYAVTGFGYILPATFLPVLARAVVDDPVEFGAAWPVFGLAAAVSAVVGGLLFQRFSRRRVHACCHVLMAGGCILPVLWLSPASIAAAALLVGGTFMVATTAGMLEARAHAAGRDASAAMARMTAAFALGQMAGPIMSSLLGRSGELGGLNLTLLAAGTALLLSAAWLFGRSETPLLL